MKQKNIIMGMPITIEILDSHEEKIFEEIFSYFTFVDETFSTYKETSEISKINKGTQTLANSSPEVQEIFALADETKKLSNGYFNIKKPDGQIDPSGLVKGWAIENAAKILKNKNINNFFIDAGGDIQVSKPENSNDKWSVGIQSPFEPEKIIKVLYLRNNGLATSGTYNRGSHIYNPIGNKMTEEIVSLSVLGPNIYEADRFATAAFAMGKGGIYFIENLKGFEGYQINKDGIATETSGLKNYLNK